MLRQHSEGSQKELQRGASSGAGAVNREESKRSSCSISQRHAQFVTQTQSLPAPKNFLHSAVKLQTEGGIPPKPVNVSPDPYFPYILVGGQETVAAF